MAVPFALLSTISSTFTVVDDVVVKVAVYRTVAEFAVDEMTVLEAVTVTVNALEATPDRFTGVPKLKPAISECLYCVPDAIIATGDGVSEVGPGPTILNT